MIKTLNITKFRCFKSLAVRNLARVNLFVGLNNCGKTSLLEAVHTLARCADPQALEVFMLRRHETIWTGNDMVGRALNELDVKRLFSGHILADGGSFELQSAGDEGTRSLKVAIELQSTANEEKVNRTTIPYGHRGEIPSDALWFSIKYARDGHSVNGTTSLRISRLGGIDPIFALPEYVQSTLTPVEFISIETADSATVSDAWSKIALTPEELTVVAALQLLDESVERLGYVREPTAESGSFRVKTAGHDQPIPIGSMGAGMWRVLTLAVALVRARNGFLLVDEIDTGIHHTAMGNVWRMVLKTAEYFNVQVFATTHSLDCVRGLAQICRDSPASDSDRISMHRIERGKPESIHYSERQIVIAAERGIETR